MDATTKKMPVSLSFGSFKSDSKEFLIPFLDREELPNGFMGIESGRRIPFGMLAYIGKQISASHIIRKMGSGRLGSLSMSDAARDLNYFIEMLQAFKIGNVLEIEYLPDGDFRLTKVAERRPSEGPKLP
jgi:hypothetical protein